MEHTQIFSLDHNYIAKGDRATELRKWQRPSPRHAHDHKVHDKLEWILEDFDENLILLWPDSTWYKI